MGRTLALCCTTMLLGCGGGTPLLSGQVTGQFDTTTFTAINGFAIDRADMNDFIALGDGPLNCASVESQEPPPGSNGVISVSSLTVGNYSGVFVYVTHNGEVMGSTQGTLTISSSDATKVAGTIAYSTTIEGVQAALNGTFEVSRCP